MLALPSSHQIGGPNVGWGKNILTTYRYHQSSHIFSPHGSLFFLCFNPSFNFFSPTSDYLIFFYLVQYSHAPYVTVFYLGQEIVLFLQISHLFFFLSFLFPFFLFSFFLIFSPSALSVIFFSPPGRGGGGE
jgi:hypothetical protein